MLIGDLNVGDIVLKIGEEERFIVTSTNPLKGLPQYVSLMGPNGHSEDVWINFIKEKVGHLGIDYIFAILRMNNEDFLYVIGDGSGDEHKTNRFERVISYITNGFLKN